ncbi:MAG: hypothetical protein Q8L86_04315 [Vicinamibacterales bacterium]|nr:hypothetical protein [Vicinamibacterales bacterium]
MPFGPRLPTILICLLTGTALWLSRGVLDQVVIDEGAARLALLPPGLVWLAYVVLACMGVFALHRVATHPKRGTHVPRASLGPVLLPLWALLVLVVPFLPWLADVWPALQVLAGPLRWIVWVVVAGQLLWVLWQDRLLGASRLAGCSLTQLTAAVWLTTAIAGGLVAGRLTTGVLFPGGDEPHYLVIAQSLWRDGDLKIENNHARGDYLEYYDRDLAPHYQTRGVDGEIYSIHPIGMPLVIAPVYAAGGYPLVVIFFVLVAATTMAWLWRVHTLWTGAAGAATFGWAAVAGSAPFLINAFGVYPEVLAGLAVATAFSLSALARSTTPRPVWTWLVVGAAIAVLPWLSTKYAPLSAALAAVALGRHWLSVDPRLAFRPVPGARTASTLVLVPYLLSLAAWFSFFQMFWGSPRPEASYAEAGQLALSNLPVGVAGLLFDQEFGVLPVAPVFILAFAGLWTMARRGGEARRVALEWLLVVGALVGTIGAFHHWWGGSSVVGRNLMSVLALLALPVAVQFGATPAGSARRAAQHLLLWIGAAITVTLVMGQDGLLLASARDGSAALLEWLSPRWALWSLVPTFIHHDAVTAWLHSLAWIALTMAAGWGLARVRTRTAGAASLAALTILIAGLAAGSLVLPWLPSDPPLPSADLRARSRLPALDSFDTAMRPLAIAYTPFRPGSAVATTPLLSLVVLPDLRTDPQPLRVLHNGRLSLPAGRYALEVAWADRDPLPVRRPTGLWIQVGRTGPPWQVHEVTPAPGGVWRHTVDLPLDAPFFGLRGSLELERSIAAITVRPLAIVDAGLRVRTPDVLGGTWYGDFAAYFHDEQIYAEPTGFWTRGGRAATLTLAGPEGAPLALHMHGGGRANRVTVTARDWTHTVDLTPAVTAEVALPAGIGGLLTLTIATEQGFMPAEVSPGSEDKRTLGVWVEVVRQ